MKTLDNYLTTGIEIALQVKAQFVKNEQRKGQVIFSFDDEKANDLKEQYEKGEMTIFNLKLFKQKMKDLRNRIDEFLL